MELAFSTQHIRSICEDEDLAKEHLGSSVADVLKHRLADLRAATTIGDLVVGNPRVLNGKNELTIDLSHGHRIVLAANHVKNPSTYFGDVKWAEVKRLKVVKIEKDNN